MTSPLPAGTSGAQYVHRGQWRPWECNLRSFLLPRKFAGKRPICPALFKEGRKALPGLCLALPALGHVPARQPPYLCIGGRRTFPSDSGSCGREEGDAASAPALRHQGRGRARR